MNMSTTSNRKCEKDAEFFEKLSYHYFQTRIITSEKTIVNAILSDLLGWWKLRATAQDVGRHVCATQGRGEVYAGIYVGFSMLFLEAQTGELCLPFPASTGVWRGQGEGKEEAG